jgi:hypothetical protein
MYTLSIDMTPGSGFAIVFSHIFSLMEQKLCCEPRYRVTMLARGEWARCPGTPPMVKGLVWYTDGSKTVEGTGVGVYGQSVNRRLSISLDKHATVFQAEVYAILACVFEIETQDRPELVSPLIVRRL